MYLFPSGIYTGPIPSQCQLCAKPLYIRDAWGVALLWASAVVMIGSLAFVAVLAELYHVRM